MEPWRLRKGDEPDMACASSSPLLCYPPVRAGTRSGLELEDRGEREEGVAAPARDGGHEEDRW
jgi:hypothetical protein